MRLTLAFFLLCSACAGSFSTRIQRPAVTVPRGVTHAEENYDGYNFVRMFEQSWRPADNNVRGTLIIVHGLKDHSTRYNELAIRLAQHGYVVHAFDMRGFGSSGGRRVYVESFDEYIEDLASFVDVTRSREYGKPIFLLGHGLGGAVALEYVLSRKPELTGLVLSGAALKDDRSGFNRFMTRVTGTVLTLLATFSVDVDHLSQDPAVVAACKADPLIDQGNGPARTARELIDAMSEIVSRESELRMPALILHGGADVIFKPDG
ncbi:MAG TPA: alpha/beta hydrolase, partial [Myxococcales bacterium]|nr:alpha/beta hydrolase [Myxococcales bacterium]